MHIYIYQWEVYQLNAQQTQHVTENSDKNCLEPIQQKRRQLYKIYHSDAAARATNYARMQQVAQIIVQQVPGSALSTDHAGIMELQPDTPHGQSLVQTAGLAVTMIEVDLTPNRPDCASVIGIAREIAGITGRPLCLPVQDAAVAAPSEEFSVAVESPDLCPRYSARLIRGVKIGPSPLWLKARLLAIGQRPINNIVDITNILTSQKYRQ